MIYTWGGDVGCGMWGAEDWGGERDFYFFLYGLVLFPGVFLEGDDAVEHRVVGGAVAVHGEVGHL